MYENDGGLLSPRDAYRLMLKDYPDGLPHPQSPHSSLFENHLLHFCGVAGYGVDLHRIDAES